MRKIVAAINMTLDGFCDHTAIVPDEQIHQYYTDLLKEAGVILYGRITYELMEFWRPFVKNPSGEKSMDDFAMAINRLPKIVFSHTLKSVDWESAELATRSLEEEVLELKGQPGKDIFIGSRSLIVSLANRNLIDEYQLCVHPVVLGKGLPLFDNINDKMMLKLVKTKTFTYGAIILYYQRAD
jgi:dihydrofolate reductase